MAIIALPGARMGSVGAMIDAVEVMRAQIRRQYGAVDALPAADRFDVAELVLLAVDRGSVTTVGGYPLPVQGVIDKRPHDVVLVADYAREIANAMHDEESSALTAASEARLVEWLRWQAGEGALLAGSGGGVALLAQAGLLDGRQAAVPRWLVEEMRVRFPTVRCDLNQPVVEEDGVVTGMGGAADPALALTLVEAFTSRNSAIWLARHMGLAERSDDAAGGDPLAVRAQNWLAEHFSRDITIAQLASAMGVSRRTLHRHFVNYTRSAPLEHLQSLRVEAAKRMLERTPFTVERIAALVGYGDIAFFRRTFRRLTGRSPSEWRKAARGGEREEDAKH